MSAALQEIMSELDKLIKRVPFLDAPKDWKQSGWVRSIDQQLSELDEPLVSVKLYKVWTKIVQQRQNGWDGDSFFVSAMFDQHAKPADIAAYLCRVFERQLEVGRKKMEEA